MGTSEEKEPRATNLADLRAKDSVSGRCELTNTQQYLRKSNWIRSGFPDGSEVKNPPANAGHASWIPGSGRSPGGGKSNPLQYSCLEKVPSHGQRSLAVYSPWVQSQTRLSNSARSTHKFDQIMEGVMCHTQQGD